MWCTGGVRGIRGVDGVRGCNTDLNGLLEHDVHTVLQLHLSPVHKPDYLKQQLNLEGRPLVPLVSSVRVSVRAAPVDGDQRIRYDRRVEGAWGDQVDGVVELLLLKIRYGHHLRRGGGKGMEGGATGWVERKWEGVGRGGKGWKPDNPSLIPA